MLALVLAAALAAPNVILISADTLRADHLGAYGYAFPTSPNLDALAAQSLVFEDMICEVPLTGPSFSAMLSSRFPRETGATRNALALPEENMTVPQVFQSTGYHTFCVQSNWTLKRKLSGLDRGFDTYDDDFHQKRWGIIKAERDGDEVTKIALELLDAWDRAKPLFAWIHYSDPHAPYKRHRKFDVSKDFEHDDQRIRKVTRSYDSEIAYMDAQIGLLLEHLPKENTYIVFVGDHGESLWDHEFLGHGRRIYQAGMHIPLFLSGPGITAGRSRVPARGVDVGTTLLSIAGLPRFDGMRGTDLLRAPPSADRVRVVETYGGAVPHLPGAKALMAKRPPQRQGAIINGWKLIIGGNNAELFNLHADPAELENLASKQPERVTHLRAAITAWEQNILSGEATQADLTEADREALDALGYID